MSEGNKFQIGLHKCRQFMTVEPYMLLMSLASSLNYPSQQGLIYNRICLIEYPDLRNSTSNCDDLLSTSEQNHVKTVASHWNVALQASFYTPQIIAIFLCGSLSDRVGPKLLLPVPSILCLAATLVYLFEALTNDAPLWPFVIGNLLQGMGGGYICSFMLGYSYLCLKTSQKNRTLSMSIGEAAANLGIFLGFLIAGPICDNWGFKYIWVVNAIFYSFLIFYSVFWVPGVTSIQLKPSVNSEEGSKNENSQQVSCAKFFGFDTLLDGIVSCYRGNEDFGSSVIIGCLIYVIATCNLSGVAESSISYLYTKDDPIDLSQSEYSYFLGAKYLTGCIGSTIILPACCKLFSIHDTTYAVIGILARILTEIYFSICQSKLMLFFIPAFSLLANIVSPSCRSAITKIVPCNKIGFVFSIVAVAECLISIAGSTLFSAIYPSTLSWWPGFCYALIAFILFSGFCVLMVVKFKAEMETGPNCVLEYEIFENEAAAANATDSEQQLVVS